MFNTKMSYKSKTILKYLILEKKTIKEIEVFRSMINFQYDFFLRNIKLFFFVGHMVLLWHIVFNTCLVFSPLLKF